MPSTNHRFFTRKNALCLTGVALASLASFGAHSFVRAQNAPQSSDLPSFLSTFYTEAGGGGGKIKTTWVQSIAVSAPAYCSAIKGDTTVIFKAPGMTVVRALCWQQPTKDNPIPGGHDAEVASDIRLDADGSGSFVFHADQFPNGPLNLRIYAKDKDGGSNQDYCELQLFNQGGVVWNQGVPKADPPAAQGMKVAFSDDFNGPLSIARDNSGRYWTHWPGGDGSSWPFTDFESPLNPFSQVKGQTKNYLRIHASKPEGSKGAAGTLTPVHRDKTGFTAKAPCYFECRFLAQNATGTWAAFWLLTHGGEKGKTDELDAIEAYGTNSKTGGIWTGYHTSTHFWGQTPPAWVKDKSIKGMDGNPFDAHKLVKPMELGGKNSWSTTFHTYGVLIKPDITAYYLDDIEVLRHPTGQLSATQPISFLVNLAIGGAGWKADLQRYGNQSDMWVDYIRVYQGDVPATPVSATPADPTAAPAPTATPTTPAPTPAGDLTQPQLVDILTKMGAVVKTEGDVPTGDITSVTFVYTHTRKVTSGGYTIPNYPVTDDLVRQLSRLPKVTWLEFNMSDKLTGAAIKDIGTMKQLTHLALGAGVRLDDTSMADIAGLTKLNYLRLSGAAGISDKGFAVLENFKDLETLWVAETRFADATMQYLKPLTKLRDITFYGTNVTDTGADVLLGLPNLTSVRMGPRMSSAATKKLQAALPNCRFWR